MQVVSDMNFVFLRTMFGLNYISSKEVICHQCFKISLIIQVIQKGFSYFYFLYLHIYTVIPYKKGILPAENLTKINHEANTEKVKLK